MANKGESIVASLILDTAGFSSGCRTVVADASKMGTSAQNAGQGISQLAAQSGTAGTKLSGVASKASGVSGVASKMGGGVKDAAAQVEKLGNKSGKTGTKMSGLKERVSNVKDAFQKFRVKIKEAGEEQEKQKQKINGHGSALDSLKGKIVGVISAYAGISTLKNIVQTGMEFESAMAKVGTIADTSIKSLSELSGGVRELSNKTGAASADISEALYQAISAGANTADALGLVEVATKSAKGGFTDTATAVDGLTSVLNTYGMQTTDAMSLANQFLVTQNKGKTTFGDLASSIGLVAPVAKAAGVGTQELLSSIAALTANGLGTSEAITGVKSALSNVIKPTSEAAKQAKALGMDFSVTALQTKGLAGFMQEIKEKTKGNTDTMAQLFGSVEGLNAVLTLTGDGGMKLMNDTMTEMSNNTTAVDDAFNGMQNTVSGQLGVLKSNFENFKISIFDSMGSEELKGAVSGLAELMQENAPQIASAIGGIASGLVGVIQGVIDFAKFVVDNWGAIGPVVAGVAAAFGAFKAITGIMTAYNTVMGIAEIVTGGVTWPILVVVGAIGALVAVGVAVVQNWDWIKEKAGQCWEGIKGFFGGIGDWFSGKWNAVKVTAGKCWDGIKETVGNALNGVKEYAKTKLDTVKRTYEEHGGGIKGAAFAAMEGVKQYYSTGYDAINKLTGGKLGEIVNGVSEKLSPLKEKISGAFHSAFEYVKESYNTGQLKPIVDGVVNTFNGVKTAIADKFNGIKEVVKEKLATLQEAFVWIKDKVVDVFDNFKEAFAPIAEGIGNIALGIRSVFVTAFQGIKSIVTTIIDGIKTFFINSWNIIKTTFTNIINGIKQNFVNFGNGVKEAFLGVVNGIKTIFTGIVDIVKGIFGVVVGIFTLNGQTIKESVQKVGQGISEIFNGVEQIVVGVWNAITSFAMLAFNNVKTVVVNTCNGIKAQFDNVKNTISTIVNNVKDTFSRAFEAIKTKISSIMDTVKETVKKAIDKIKDFFKFDWELPKIKLPHIDITGEWSFNPPSVPSFGIKWYANGGIMTKPTVFGGAGNNALVGGEAGAEAILPLKQFWSNLRQYTAESQQNARESNRPANNNTFYINIDARDRTDEEIADSLVPKLKLKLENV